MSNESRYVENVCSNLILTDARDRVTYSSKSFYMMTSRQDGDVLGKSIFENLYNEDSGNFRKIFTKVKANKKAERYRGKIFPAKQKGEEQAGWLIPQFDNGVYTGMVCTVEWGVSAQKSGDSSGTRTFGTEIDLLFYSIESGIRFLDENMYSVRVNEGFLKLVGLPVEEVLGRKCYEVFRGEACDNESCPFRQVEKGKHFILEERVKECNDGKKIICQLQANSVFDSDRTFYGIIENFRDITSFRVNEKLVQKSEERYSLAQRVANIGSWDWNIITGDLIWSDTIEQIFGFGKGEFGATYEAFLETVHPDDREFVIQSVNECVEQGKEYFIEHRTIWPDGTVRWMSETGDVIRNKQGVAIRMLGIVQDITKRKEAIRLSEERLNELSGLYALGKIADSVETIEEIFEEFLNNIIPKFVRFQENVSAKIEYEGKEYKIGLECKNLVSAPIIFDNVEKGRLYIGYSSPIALEDQVESRLVKGFAQRLSEVIMRILAKQTLMRSNKELKELVAERTVELLQTNRKLKQEILEGECKEKELRISEEKLRQLSTYLQKAREEERTRIAREVHDDLGQSLTAMKMDILWIEKRFDTESEELHDKLISMTKLIDQTIKSVQKISAELRPGMLDDLGLSAAIEWQAKEFQKRSGVSMTVDMDIDDDEIDQELSTNLFRIFQETLTNIARHSGATEVSLSLSKNNNRLVFLVSDNGCGISEENKKKTTSFGLIGIHERVRPWNGEVTITGMKGEGTIVKIVIPVK
ncbi:MAG: PAS domain-containing protein [bacterium]|nr:PAS domain-containing protein [bacterium]